MKQFLLSCLLLLLLFGCSRNEVSPSPTPISANKANADTTTPATIKASGSTANKTMPVEGNPMICHTMAHDDGTLYLECRPVGSGGNEDPYDGEPEEQIFRTTEEFGYISYRIFTQNDEVLNMTSTHRTNPSGYVQNGWTDNSANTPGYFSFIMYFTLNNVVHRATVTWDKSSPGGTLTKDF